MYPNLIKEMQERDVSPVDIASLLRMGERNVAYKLDGAVKFSLPEAKTISEKLFPGTTIDYLFAESTETSK